MMIRRDYNAGMTLAADLAVTLVVLQTVAAKSLGYHLPWVLILLPVLVASVPSYFLAERSGLTALPFGANTVFVFVVFDELVGALQSDWTTRGASAAIRRINLLSVVSASLILYSAFVLVTVLLLLRFRPTLSRRALMLPLIAMCSCYLVLTPLLKLGSQPVAVLAGAICLWLFLSSGLHAWVTWTVPLDLWAAINWLLPTAHAAPPPIIDTSSVAILLELRPHHWLFADEFWRRVVPMVALLATTNAFSILENVASAQEAGDAHNPRSAALIASAGTLISALCAACAPITVYVGHPVYKRMGASARYPILAVVGLSLLLLPFGSWIVRWTPVFIAYGAVIYIGTCVAMMVRHQVSSPREAVAAAIPMIPIFAFWSQSNLGLQVLPTSLLTTGSAYLSVGWALLLWSDGGRREHVVVSLLLAVASVLGLVHGDAFSSIALLCASVYAGLAVFFAKCRSPEP